MLLTDNSRELKAMMSSLRNLGHPMHMLRYYPPHVVIALSKQLVAFHCHDQVCVAQGRVLASMKSVTA